MRTEHSELSSIGTPKLAAEDACGWCVVRYLVVHRSSDVVRFGLKARIVQQLNELLDGHQSGVVLLLIPGRCSRVCSQSGERMSSAAHH
jgi:hypothetical protein